MFDLRKAVTLAQSLRPASRTAAADGVTVDAKGYEAALAVLDAGAVGGTSPSFTFILHESDDDSTWAGVADADVVGGTATIVIDDAAEDDQVYVRSYIGAKRYLRWEITAVTGTSPTLLCSAGVVLGHKRHQS